MVRLSHIFLAGIFIIGTIKIVQLPTIHDRLSSADGTSQADLDASGWLQLKEDSPISAASFHGVAYCTLHGRVKKSEGARTDDSTTSSKDVAWYAELRAASARLSAAKALVQLSKSKAFHADL